MTRPTTKTAMTFFVLLAVILSVSLYDCLLTVQYQSGLKQHEENPVARFLLEMDDWNVGRFLFVKSGATLVVVCFLVALYDLRKDMGLAVAVGVTAWQIFLAVFYLDIITI